MFKILLIEDDGVSRLFLKSYISKLLNQEVEVDDASDGNIALKKFKNGEHSLIITDLNIPSLDGLDLIKRIREINETIPILVETGFGHKYDLSGYNINGILNKPIKANELREYLEDIVQDLSRI